MNILEFILAATIGGAFAWFMMAPLSSNNVESSDQTATPQFLSKTMQAQPESAPEPSTTHSSDQASRRAPVVSRFIIKETKKKLKDTIVATDGAQDTILSFVLMFLFLITFISTSVYAVCLHSFEGAFLSIVYLLALCKRKEVARMLGLKTEPSKTPKPGQSLFNCGPQY